MRVGPGNPKNALFFCYFPLSIFFCSYLWQKWGGREREAPLGRHGSLWVAAGDAGRGWDTGKMRILIPLVALGQRGPHVAGYKYKITNKRRSSKEGFYHNYCIGFPIVSSCFHVIGSLHASYCTFK